MSRSSIQLEQIQDQGATISRHVRETELRKKRQLQLEGEDFFQRFIWLKVGHIWIVFNLDTLKNSTQS